MDLKERHAGGVRWKHGSCRSPSKHLDLRTVPDPALLWSTRKHQVPPRLSRQTPHGEGQDRDILPRFLPRHPIYSVHQGRHYYSAVAFASTEHGVALKAVAIYYYPPTKMGSLTSVCKPKRRCSFPSGLATGVVALCCPGSFGRQRGAHQRP